ncbi:MAG: type IV pilus twitching motility protein PilT [Akkermansia sp.]|nr:type IV pilus twitching motility protein PilT [Akkermansia sp.]
MSDTSYIYDNVDAYLSLAAEAASPSVYLGTGLQPYLMQAPAYAPAAPDAGVVDAQTMEALVNSCTTEQERATLAENGAVDFIKDGPVGKYHGYVYNQEGGYLIILISLRVDDYLNQGVNADCSDVHLPTCYPPTWRRYGNLVPMWQDAPMLTRQDTVALVDSFLTDKERKRLDETGDVDFAYQNAYARYRASVVSQRLGYDLCFRIINTKVKSMKQINLPEEYVVPLTRFTNGLILVTGSVGSGKSTSLAAIIDFINADRKDHIITLEDPIEFLFEPATCQVNQREVHKHTESFGRALRAALREDPDIIMVGEMRNLETISLALTAAETGHLVLGTLHTGSAARTVDRILDAFPVEEREHIRIMLSESLRGILSQQLIPKKDGSGRVMALEMLVNTAAVANCIREGKTFMIPGLIQTGKAQGMRLMDDALQDLYLRNLITAEECDARATDKVIMERFLKEHPEGATTGIPQA